MPAGNVGGSSTSVFNLVLNTVNASGFTGTLGKAQNAINAVVVSLNRASQAASSGRVNAQLQQQAYDKVAATYARASASLDVFRIKMQANAQTLGAAQQRQSYLNVEVARLTQTLQYQSGVYAKLQANTNTNASVLKTWHTGVTNTTKQLSEMQKELNVVNKVVAAATSKETLYQAQLKAREERMKGQEQTMKDIKTPLKWWESLLATGMQLFAVTNKVASGFDKITLTAQRAMRIADKLRYIFSGGKAETFVGGKPETVLTTTGEAGYDTGPAVSAQQRLGNAVTVVAEKFNLLRQAISFALGQALYQGAYALENALKQLGTGAVNAAARFQELSLVAALLGSRAGMTQQQVDELIKKIRAFGIEGANAAELVSQFARYNLDLAKATDLARVAQDAAVLSGENSSDTLARLVYGITTYNTEVLRTAGLNVNIGLSEKELATSLHISTENLTENQKALATLNAVLKEGTKIAGTYEAAMSLPGKQLRSLPRLIDDLMIEMGTPFQAAFANVVGGISKFVATLTDTFKPGGKLRPMLDGLGQLADLISKPLMDLAPKAVAWGQNLITSFADGMLRGIVAVMDALIEIAHLVTFWLAPGSPPKLLPNLTRWGTQAMTEYFRGFTLADFSMFKEIGGTIETMLRSVLINVGTGAGAEAAKGGSKISILNRILGSREALSQALTEMERVGAVSEAAFQKIFRAMGGASREMQDYIRSSFALEQQNRKVAAAQKVLDDAVAKYNELLKPVEAALQTITDAQTDLADAQKKTMLELILKDPNATLAEKDQARLEIQRLDAEKAKRLLVAEQAGVVDAAQTALDAEVAKQKTMQTTVDQQKAVLDQQVEQNRLLQEYIDLLDQLAAAQESAAGGGGANQLPKPPAGGGGGLLDLKKAAADLQTWILGLIGKVEQLKTAWGEAWAAILAKMQPALNAFNGFRGSIDRLKQSIGRTKTDIENLIAKIIAFTTTDLSLAGTSIFGNLEGTVDELVRFWDEHHQQILDIVFVTWQVILVTVSVFGVMLAGILHGTMQGINGDWAGAWETMKNTASDALDLILLIPGVKRQDFDNTWSGIWSNAGIILEHFWKTFAQPIVASLIFIFTGFVDFILGVFTQNWSQAWDGIVRIFKGFWTLLSMLATTLWGLLVLIFGQKLLEMRDNWVNFWVGLYNIFVTTKDRLWSSFTRWLSDTLTYLILKAVEIETQWGTALNQMLTSQILKIVDLLLGWNKWLADAKQAVIDAVKPYYDAGAALVQGLIDGAKSKAQAMVDAVKGVVQGAIAAAKRLLGISGDPTPSTQMAYWIGEPMMRGISQGILASSGQLKKALATAIGDSVQVSMLATSGGLPGSSTQYTNVTNLHYSPTYTSPPRAVTDNFALMKAML